MWDGTWDSVPSRAVRLCLTTVYGPTGSSAERGGDSEAPPNRRDTESGTIRRRHQRRTTRTPRPAGRTPRNRPPRQEHAPVGARDAHQADDRVVVVGDAEGRVHEGRSAVDFEPDRAAANGGAADGAKKTSREPTATLQAGDDGRQLLEDLALAPPSPKAKSRRPMTMAMNDRPLPTGPKNTLQSCRPPAPRCRRSTRRSRGSTGRPAAASKSWRRAYTLTHPSDTATISARDNDRRIGVDDKRHHDRDGAADSASAHNRRPM